MCVWKGLSLWVCGGMGVECSGLCTADTVPSTGLPVPTQATQRGVGIQQHCQSRPSTIPHLETALCTTGSAALPAGTPACSPARGSPHTPTAMPRHLRTSQLHPTPHTPPPPPPHTPTRMAPWPLVSIMRGQGTPASFSSMPLLMMFLYPFLYLHSRRDKGGSCWVGGWGCASACCQLSGMGDGCNQLLAPPSYTCNLGGRGGWVWGWGWAHTHMHTHYHRCVAH